jgi:hypothetical protein
MSSNAPPVPADAVREPQVIVFGHSWLVYWWPVWAIGYLMALLTRMNPVDVQIAGTVVQFSPRANLGIIYCMVVLLTILITSTSMRGLTSLVVVLAVGLLALLFEYLGWWPDILHWLGQQPVYMDFSFYMFMSTGLLVLWLLVVGVFDHLGFWRIRAGQVTHEYVLGAVESSYDTDNMVFTKQQSDIFRNWILGLGSGDLQIQTMGGRGMTAKISNVLFVNARVNRIQRMIATKPEVMQHP